MLLYIMLCVVLAYLMLFAALSNAVCFIQWCVFLLLIFANALCFMLCLGLLTHSLFISTCIVSVTVNSKTIQFFFKIKY